MEIRFSVDCLPVPEHAIFPFSFIAPNTIRDCYWCRFVALCLLSNDVMDYNIVSQGKTVIPGVDDGEEMKLTDVSPELTLLAHIFHILLSFFFFVSLFCLLRLRLI